VLISGPLFMHFFMTEKVM